MADLGWIKAGEDGKWRWPFGSMQPGDYFKVDALHRSVGRVRNLANQAGASHGCRFSVVTDSDGAALVRRVSAAEADRLVTAMGYDSFRKRMQTLYRLDMDNIPWFAIDRGRDVEAPMWGGEERRKVLVHVDSRTFVVSLYFDGFWIERVRDGLTLVEWIMLQEKCEELFGPCERQGALLFSKDDEQST